MLCLQCQFSVAGCASVKMLNYSVFRNSSLNRPLIMRQGVCGRVRNLLISR